MYSIEQQDEQLVGTSAPIRYRLSFIRAGSHLVDIEMEVDEPGAAIVLGLPVWIPGSYKVRDFVSFQGDVEAFDAQGESLVIEWVSTSRMTIVTAGTKTLRLRYRYYGNERSVRNTHISRHHAFINPANCLMYVEGGMSRVHHVAIDSPWRHVSTALSPVSTGVWGALNYDILVDSPIEIGNHFVQSYERHGARHDIAITGSGDFDTQWIVERTKAIVDQGLAMWGPLPYDRYLFIIQMLPGEYGGLEHARCSVNMFDSGAFDDMERISKFLALLCHEYFHLWNVKRIRPIELGPFDYERPSQSRMLWLAEGVTSYYDALMAYRCGFLDRAGYLRVLSDHTIGRLQDTPGRGSMSVKDSSFLSWVKLYVPTPDSHNRFPSYYVKGGVIFLLLDVHIIAETRGARRLDDGMRALWGYYRANPGVGITEQEFIGIVSDAVGVSIGPVILPWLETTFELPIAEVVSRIGLEWRAVPPRTSRQPMGEGVESHPGSRPDRWIGIATENAGSSLRVGKVWRDSPAEVAGIGAGDEIIAVNGIRTITTSDFETAVRGARNDDRLLLLCATERSVYEVHVPFVPRDVFELVEAQPKGELEQTLFDLWLHRDTIEPLEHHDSQATTRAWRTPLL